MCSNGDDSECRRYSIKLIAEIDIFKNVFWFAVPTLSLVTLSNLADVNQVLERMISAFDKRGDDCLTEVR